MIIDGVERGILLFIDDEEGNEVGDFFFHDFQEFNKFVNENYGKYSFCECSYSIVEVINGKPEPFSWTAPIDFMDLEEDEIEDLIYEFRSQEKQDKELFSRINAETEIRTEEFKMGNPDEKIRWKNEYTYVCPYCMQDLDHCECTTYPYQLIQIDTNILPIIRILNRKGYKTISCCGGHLIDKFEKCTCIYIGFKEKYDFVVPYPDNAIYTSGGNLRYEKGELDTVEELAVFQKDTLAALLDWAEALPSQ